MRIAIVNQPLGNRGDEAAHRAIIRSLAKKFNKAQIDVIFLNEKQQLIDDFVVESDLVRYINLNGLIKASHKCMKLTMVRNNMLFTFLHPLLRKFDRIITKYDCVICAPGGICMGGFMKWDHIWQLYVALKHNIKTIYWGRSIGPFSDEDAEHLEFKRISRSLIKCFDYISLRDDTSFKIAKTFGVSSDLTVDSAFLETPDCSIPEYVVKKIGTMPYVIFVPNELIWHYKYKDKSKKCIDEFYLYVIEALVYAFPGHCIVMLPQTCKSVINDYGYFVSLREQSKYKNKIIVIDENQGSDIQQCVIRNSHFVVGARYHSVIFAINNNVPFLSLSYEHKMKGMLKTLNLNDRQVDIENIFNNTDTPVALDVLREIKNKLNSVTSVNMESDRAKNMVCSAFDRMCVHIEDGVYHE